MTSFKKLSIIFSAFIMAFFGEIAINLACGGEMDPYDYYISYYPTNIQGDEYASFSFTDYSYLYSEEEPQNEGDVNSQEWANYLKIDKNDVNKIMYHSDSLTSVMVSNLDKKTINTLPDSLKNNSFLNALVKNKKALQYFLFAKSCEPYTISNQDYWNPIVRDTVAIVPKAFEAEKGYKNVGGDKFLKLRYAYQATRMARYANEYKLCEQMYTKLVEPIKTESAVKGWALALYAGSLRKNGKRNDAAYLFSKVFASNPERRIQAYKNYWYIDTKVDSVLMLTKNDEEKANIYAINSFNNSDFDLPALKKIYQYAPKSLLVGVMLTREINKFENRLILNKNINAYYSNRYDSNGLDIKIEKYQDSVSKIAESVRDFALKIANDKVNPQANLGIITAAYLSWMRKDDNQALEDLKSLNFNQLPPRFQDQYRIIRLLINGNRLATDKNFDKQILLPELKWLDEKRYAENKLKGTDNYDWANYDKPFSKTTRNFYQQIMAISFLKSGDTATAALSMLKADLESAKPNDENYFKNMGSASLKFWQNYLSPKSMEKIQQLKINAKNDPFIAFLTSSINQLNNDDFYELYGTTFLRTHQYESAAKMFAKVSVNYGFFVPSNWYADDSENKLYANPFIETVNDYPKNYSDSMGGVDKKDFAKEMVRLQKLVKTNPKNAARYYFKMANGVYQTGYYGNSWSLISYDWSSYSGQEEPLFNYDSDYKLAKTAKVWYQKARSLSTDEDFKAKCTFMLAKCEQKLILMNSNYESYGYYDIHDVNYKTYITANYQNPYFKEMSQKYSKTKFFNRAVNECSYMSDFIPATKAKLK